MNPIIKSLLPPALVTAARSVKTSLFPANNEPPEFAAILAGESAWDGRYNGWSHQSIADAQRQKWPTFLSSLEGTEPFGWAHEAPLAAIKPGRQRTDVAEHNTIMSFAYALGRAAVGNDASLSVLDWGGGVGHYCAYARKLYPELKLDYTVKDFTALCATGHELVPQARFLSDDDAVFDRPYDLVFVSGSLQYSRDLYAILGKICDGTSKWLLVTRTPFIEQNEEFVFTQRAHRFGYMAEFPAWFVNRGKFLKFVTSRGLRMDREFLLGDYIGVPNAPEQCVHRGFLFKRD